MLNCSKLLDHPSPARPGVLQNSNLSTTEDQALIAAREIIRADLRQQLPALLDLPKQSPRPKFIMQGSKVYRTLNKAYYPPGQQADLDDGIYIPVELLQDQSPSVASKGYINAVDSVLENTASTRNWVFKADNPCCSRLVISETAHVDIPKYCMPVSEWMRIMEARRIDAAKSMTAAQGGASASMFLEDDVWDPVDHDKVRLAHRQDGWIISDPRKVNDWVEEQIQKYPEFRRIVRLLKVWRDHQDWDHDDPKSILIMAAVAKAEWPSDRSRIDRLLLTIVAQMPVILSGEIGNPGDGEDDLAVVMDKKEARSDIINKFRGLQNALMFATEKTDSPAEAIKRLRHEFGERLPDDAELVATDTAKTDAGVRSASAPVIRPTRSGS